MERSAKRALYDIAHGTHEAPWVSRRKLADAGHAWLVVGLVVGQKPVRRSHYYKLTDSGRALYLATFGEAAPE